MKIGSYISLVLACSGLSLTAQAAVVDNFRCELSLRAKSTDPETIFNWHDDLAVVRRERTEPDFSTPGTNSEAEIHFEVQDPKTSLTYRLFLTLGFVFEEQKDAKGLVLNANQVTAFVATVLTSNDRMFRSPLPVSSQGIPTTIKEGVPVFNPLEIKSGELSLEEYGSLQYSCSFLNTVI
jgi:hypothetical protein